MRAYRQTISECGMAEAEERPLKALAEVEEQPLKALAEAEEQPLKASTTRAGCRLLTYTTPLHDPTARAGYDLGVCGL